MGGKRAILRYEESPCAHHYRALSKKISQFSQGAMVRIAHDDVVKHLDFEELTGPE